MSGYGSIAPASSVANCLAHPLPLHRLNQLPNDMSDIQIDEPLQTILTQSKNETPDLKAVESSLQTIANALRAKSAGKWQVSAMGTLSNLDTYYQRVRETFLDSLNYLDLSSRCGNRL